MNEWKNSLKISSQNGMQYNVIMKERFKIIPEVFLLLIEDNKIFLSRRYQTGYEDGITYSTNLVSSECRVSIKLLRTTLASGLVF